MIMYKLTGLSLAAIGLSGTAILAEEIGLPKITEGGALTLAGFLVYWVCREYVAMRKEYKEERKDLVESLKAMSDQNRKLVVKNTEVFDILPALKGRDSSSANHATHVERPVGSHFSDSWLSAP